MSVFERLTSLIPQVSSKERSPAPPSPPPSLSPPVIRRRPVQVPSLAEDPLACRDVGAEHISSRSFVPLFSDGTFRGAFDSQGKHPDGASTLPRTKSRTYSPSARSVKPSITVSPAPNLDSPPAVSARLNLSAWDPSPLSSTLPPPTLRLSPSPTSGCQGADLEASGTRQPSPVARERRARSISITNTNAGPVSSKEKPVHERGSDVFVPHPALRGDSSRTYAHRQAALTQNSFLLHQKVDLGRNESSDLHKSKIPPSKTGLRATLQPNVNLKQKLERLPNAATGAPASELNRRGRHRRAQPAGFGSKEPLQDHLCAGGHADLAAPPLGPASPQRLWSPSTGPSQRRQFKFHTAGDTDAPLQRPWDENTTVLPGAGPSPRPPHQPSAAQNKTPPHTQRWRPREEDADIRMKVESVLKASSGTCPGSCSGRTGLPLECSRSQRQRCRAAPCNQNMPAGPNESRAALTPSDAQLNQKAEGPECSWQSRVRNWPLSVEQRSHIQKGSGTTSNGASDSLLPPQRREDQRAADATPMASSFPNRPYYRALYLEEDPCYVTMYHPGSVYVGE